ncbi:MAG: hypothetical protein LUD50_06555 [Clostridia bacterium]|nr:hypothetical protein [Clostridia bacterium]
MSIRTSGGDRAFLKPYEDEGVYLFLTVGDHDKARERAERKQIDVNPYTGVLQIYEFPEDVLSPETESEKDGSPSESVTRARQGVCLTSWGTPSVLLKDIQPCIMQST